MSLRHALFSSLIAVSLVACSSSPKIQEAKREPGKESVLTRDQAMYRARQLKKINYQLWFKLGESDEFEGRVTTTFDLREEADRFLSTLRMDFTEGKIQSLRVNEQEWSTDKIADRYDGGRIEFRVSELMKGQNKVEISFTHPYSKTGNGLYRFKDPVDGRSYIYSHLEPYYANLIFPCFDQPDLKASYELTVEAPAEWKVIANMPERDSTKVDGRTSWQFPPSPVFSTYLFALHAGPFQAWKSDAEGTPLRLFARASETKHVAPQNWFNVTKKGLEFFTDFYGVPYPYGKYDQVIVPNLNAGAMENIAAVTFNEKWNFRSKPTQEQLMDQADVILHEMAHMWFGNLVTMRWWNGLWLNEAFASYMAYVALKDLKLFPGVEESFFLGMKEWAYLDDSLVTNHPIEVSVADTSQAFSIFDGITYGKGASSLQQLHQFVGDEDFREGLHRYFLRFANRNTVLNDLTLSIGQAASIDLSSWQKAWLQSKGTNYAEAKLACAEGKVESLKILQTAPGEGNVLRPHQMKIAFYRMPGGVLTRGNDTFSVKLNGAETLVEEAAGKPCPAMVFLNDGDLDFVKQVFSSDDLEAFKRGLSSLKPDLNRMMVWANLGWGVRAGTVSPATYLEIAKTHLPREKNAETLKNLTQFLGMTILPVIPPESRRGFLKEWHALALRQLGRAPSGSDLQVAWWRLATLTVHDEASAKWALDLATAKKKLPGFSLGTDRAYSLVQAAARVAPVSDEVYSALRAKDSSEEALAQELRARAFASDADSKFGVFELLTRTKTEPAEWNDPARLRKVMRGLLHPWNETRARAWAPQYVTALKKVASEQDETYAEEFARGLYPELCDEATIATIESGAAKLALPAPVRKAVLESVQLDRECVRARALLQNPTPPPAKEPALSAR